MERSLTAAKQSLESDSGADLVRLQELLTVTSQLLPGGAQRDLRNGIERLREGRVNVVVLGEFKRGKSSLINAIVGRDVLPTGVLPMTSAVTVLRSGPTERLSVGFEDGHIEVRPLSDLRSFATEQANPKNRLGVTSLVVELAEGPLSAGLQLVDTPGTGSIHEHNSAIAESFLTEVDAALCVLAADQPISAQEQSFFAGARQTVPRLLFAINKIDLLSVVEREQAQAFIDQATAHIIDGNREAGLLSVSARTGEGIAELRDRLRHLAESEGRQLARAAVFGLASARAEEAAEIAALELQALELPLDELELRSIRFEERLAAIQKAGEEAAELLSARLGQMLDEQVNRPLLSLCERQGPRMVTELGDFAENHADASARRLAPLLEEQIEDKIRNTFLELAAQYEADVATQLAELQAAHSKRVAEVRAEVEQAAEENFGVAGGRLEDVGLRSPSRFDFKLSDPDHMLDILVSVGRRSLPGKVGRRLVIRDAARRLLEMLDRHAGRLRSELVERAGEAERLYRRDLALAGEEAIEGTRGAIARARSEQRRGRETTASRRDELVDLRRQLGELAGDLGRG